MSDARNSVRRRFTGQQKVAILREHLVEKKPVSEVCDKYALNPTAFYRWQKEFFENGAAAFETRRSARDAKTLVGWIGLSRSKYYRWKDRYGQVGDVLNKRSLLACPFSTHRLGNATEVVGVTFPERNGDLVRREERPAEVVGGFLRTSTSVGMVIFVPGGRRTNCFL